MKRARDMSPARETLKECVTHETHFSVMFTHFHSFSGIHSFSFIVQSCSFIFTHFRCRDAICGCCDAICGCWAVVTIFAVVVLIFAVVVMICVVVVIIFAVVVTLFAVVVMIFAVVVIVVVMTRRRTAANDTSCKWHVGGPLRMTRRRCCE